MFMPSEMRGAFCDSCIAPIYMVQCTNHGNPLTDKPFHLISEPLLKIPSEKFGIFEKSSYICTCSQNIAEACKGLKQAGRGPIYRKGVT